MLINHFIESLKKLDRLIEAIPFEPEIVMDVGANCGIFSALISKKYPNAKVIAFEPAPELYRCLIENSKYGFEVEKYAVGSKSGASVDFYFNKESHQTSSFHINSVELFSNDKDNGIDKQKVSMVSLHDYCEQNNIALKNKSIIKIDVQGFEDEVIKGLGLEVDKVGGYLIESTWLDYGSIEAINTLINVKYNKIGVINDVFGGADLLLTKDSLKNKSTCLINHVIEK